MPDAGCKTRNPRRIFDDPLLWLLLERAINTDPRLERLLVEERRRLLTEFAGGRLTLPEGAAKFLAALAQQCFLNEYIFAESGEETTLVEDTQHRICATLQRERRIDPAALSILATYRPLGTLSFADRILRYYRPEAGDCLYPVIRMQLIAPAIERGLGDQIVPLTEVRDPVSQSVRRQYEAHPYPRWLYMDRHESAPLHDYLQRLFPHLPADEGPRPDRPRVLIAGCGTGKQAISAALRIANADVLALDLSTASLSYGLRMASDMDVDGIRWARGDILELERYPESFDVIECVGVLHHLDDPMAGWRILTGLLRGGGVMRIGLYSGRARVAVGLARRWIETHDLTPTVQGVRALRARILRLPEGDPMTSLTKASDFYSTSECRDLTFHVCEHHFSLPQIAGCLDALGLQLIGFEFPSEAVEARYRAMFPTDPAMQDLDNWHAFEDRYPGAFVSMYQFWVRKI